MSSAAQVLSNNNRVSPGKSIILTPAKRELRAELRSKGQLKRQRLKKARS